MADARELISEAIVRNSGLVLSLPSAGMLRHSKSRFLESCDDGSFWVESAPDEMQLITQLIQTRQPCGISFKNGTNKIIFAAPILEQTAALQINADISLPAVRISRPSEIKAVQRRENYRVSATADRDMKLRVWRIAEHVYLGDRPMAAQEVSATLRDISTGGLGATLTGKDAAPPRVSVDDRLRLEITWGETLLLLEGRMRYPIERPTESSIRAGIRFKELGHDLPGRKMLAALTRIVGELQRAEARRYRLGITRVA